MVVRDELQVLKPLTPELQGDSDAWPEFVLRQARVVSQKTGQLVDLLSAGPGHLVTVTGKLGKLDKDTVHLAATKTIDPPDTIRISDVGSYSFSQYEGSGGFGFWAAGKAGWYEIRSSADNYSPFVRRMEEAAGLFYYLADRYRSDDRIRVSDQYIRSLAAGYAKAEFSRRRDAEDAKDAIYEHRGFLLRSMLEGQEGLDWAASPILRHLRKQFPADYQAAVKSVKASGKTAVADIRDSTEVEADPPKYRAGTRSGRGTPRNSELPEKMDIDEDGKTAPQHALRGSLRPRMAQASKRYTGPEAPVPSERLADRESSTSDSDEDMIDGPQTSAIASNSINADVDAILNSEMSRPLPEPSYYEPNGPSDTWTCSFDGCNERIWDARKDESRKLIEAHFTRKHADEVQHLILSESASQVSVRHLLNRVHNFRASDGQLAQHLPSTSLPQRVVRRY